MYKLVVPSVPAQNVHVIDEMHIIYMLWFNFILGLNFVFLCFKLIIIYYHVGDVVA